KDATTRTPPAAEWEHPTAPSERAPSSSIAPSRSVRACRLGRAVREAIRRNRLVENDYHFNSVGARCAPPPAPPRDWPQAAERASRRPRPRNGGDRSPGRRTRCRQRRCRAALARPQAPPARGPGRPWRPCSARGPPGPPAREPSEAGRPEAAPHSGSERTFAREYRETLDLVRLAEAVGFDSAWVSEHHGASDGYLPSLLPMLAA